MRPPLRAARTSPGASPNMRGFPKVGVPKRVVRGYLEPLCLLTPTKAWKMTWKLCFFMSVYRDWGFPKSGVTLKGFSGLFRAYRGFPKIRCTFWGVPVMRTIG